ncbi:MAG: hypothetical protein ACLFST_11395, partial [Spirochaetia bacterium]
TVQRDLITVPNLFMIRNPIRVIRSSGTFVSAKLSLSYDVPRQKAEESLVKAAEITELEEPFVFINGLNNYTVEYEVFGLLKETKHYLSVKSGLRKNVLDRLHSDGIEVLSPLFVSTREYPPDSRFTPPKAAAPAESGEDEAENNALELAFDKAEEAESIEKLKELKDRFLREQEEFEKGDDEEGKPGRKSVEERRKQTHRKVERIDEIISEREERKSAGTEDTPEKQDS